MRILVTGAAGQLGHAVCARLEKLGIEQKGIDRAEVDLLDEHATREAIMGYAPDGVIHCAAYTAVDKAETEKELCFQINVTGSGNVAKSCAKVGAKMIYISSDYVFDGQGNTPFETSHAKSPLNYYGFTKSLGENEVQACLQNYFIVRISWLYGHDGNNFVKTMMRLGEQKDSIRVVADQTGSPTYAEDVADLLCEMIQTDRYGIYHATNEGFCSWHEFAADILAQTHPNCIIQPISSAEYVTAARRPQNSRLSKRSLDENGFHRLPAWQDALKRFLAIEARGVRI